MKSKTTISSHVQSVSPLVPMYLDKNGDDVDWKDLDDMKDDEIEVFAKELKIHPAILRALISITEDLRSATHSDMEDIWTRLDRIEGNKDNAKV